MARLDLAHGKLEMPPHQNFPVPQRLFNHGRGLVPSSSSPSAEEEEMAAVGNEDGLRTVTYSFAGLEMHRSASMPYVDGNGRPLRLNYTSIEAGQGGGRRAEVTLEPVVVRPPTPRSSDDIAAGSDSTQAQAQGRQGEGEAQEEGEEERLEKDFLASCYRLARMDGLWTGQFTDRRKRRDDEDA